MSITTMLTLMVSSMLIYAAPLIFTSIGGVFSERGGVVNVGLEGIMVMGAFSGVVFNLEFAQDLGALTPWLALLVGGLVGAIFSLIHAVATVHFRADHVVSGTVLNLMAPALAVFLVKVLYNKGQTDNLTQTFGRFDFILVPRPAARIMIEVLLFIFKPFNVKNFADCSKKWQTFFLI